MVAAVKESRLPREDFGRANVAIYSSKIIKAGALLADTKTVLANWNIATTNRENLDRLRRENVFGKTSRSRVEDVLAIFRQRFLGEESVTKALVVLSQRRLPAATRERIDLLESDLKAIPLRNTTIDSVRTDNAETGR